ncbi:hypothetical protein [Streptomyces cacaoi]
MSANSAYALAHRRVSEVHGLAKLNECAWCGGTAADHAYDHGDPKEIRQGGRVWSDNTAHYFAMCRACHRSYDSAHARFSGAELENELAERKATAYAKKTDEQRAILAEIRREAFDATERYIAEQDARRYA